ncbi:MAG: DEAD/DEAH box helicase, partial [Proteobacteria bacterium]|nr:DEAD/DEAH box helicase [Pseudomonadota bacterium]
MFKNTWGAAKSFHGHVYGFFICDLLQRQKTAQVLLLVPEISLTPQMTEVVTKAFGGMVSVVHSALSTKHKQQELEAIRSLKKQVLIGPRSCVFAPFAQLKLIIVDEEHDNSYKQSSGLLYNARDSAIKRAQIEGATILLGSATPSLESYYNTSIGKYKLATLSERASGKALPTAELIAAKPSTRQGKTLFHSDDLNRDSSSDISPKIIQALKNNHSQGLQSMVIVQRRGFAQFLFNLKSQETVSCPHCQVSLTL